ncbi:Clavaminate synthase-like protein [Pholiota conissans]|uniref:Clavaminate synthase-like protein n=1 Tax=Pholiota conissans TaxID=109636 RepID=A0A9P6D3U9_9AGAR|nr:Clavaminate synthase-like protein [Pholiota conissans]
MAPSVAEIQPAVAVDATQAAKDAVRTQDNGPKYPFYLPYYDLEENFPPTELFEFVDPGGHADPKKPNLLNPNTTVKNVSPYLGTKITGVQISEPSPAGLDELALFTAEHKVLAFCPIQRHSTSPNVKGYPEFHVVYRDHTHDHSRSPRRQNRISPISWHSDPASDGGDTLFLSQVEAYNRLSPRGLRAVHSAVRRAEDSKLGNGPVRREPVESEHPIVRIHPVTGEKALYINEQFTCYIVGFRQEESDALLGFLYNHIAKGADFQIRGSYQPGTVDNRLTVHSIVSDYNRSNRRRNVCLTPQAEIPIPVTA